jgi:precorrin-6A synthase
VIPEPPVVGSARPAAGQNRPVRTLKVIGVGMGDPDQLTLQAITALNEVDVFFVIDKGESTRELVQVRSEICRRHITGDYRIVQLSDVDRDRSSAEYTGAVLDWHEARAVRCEQAIFAELPDGGCGGFLVWGDPAFYDSTIRVVQRIQQRAIVDVEFDVTPGISSLQVLAAAHRIVLNGIGEPVLVTTGRRLAAAVDSGAENIVVMLDGELACRALTGEWEIYWGAYLGGPDQVLRSGAMVEVIDEIAAVRADLRRSKGWIMDTYLLRRTDQRPPRGSSR